MSFLQNFLDNLDFRALSSLAIQVIAALVCVIFHECAHGFAADRLGDSTARTRGRLSWNPLRHIDPFGLLMMIVAGVGWAKPVPVDPRNFEKPKRGMAITALAGPAANFLLAVVFFALGSLCYRLALHVSFGIMGWRIYQFCFSLLVRIAVLSVGLGLFNLIPIPPLDGSKVLFSFLPDRLYFTILRYERYIMLALFALVFLGVLDRPLRFCIEHVLGWLCLLTGFPPAVLGL